MKLPETFESALEQYYLEMEAEARHHAAASTLKALIWSDSGGEYWKRIQAVHSVPSVGTAPPVAPRVQQAPPPQGGDGVHYGVIALVHEKMLNGKNNTQFPKYNIKFDDGTQKGWWCQTINKQLGEAAKAYWSQKQPVMVVWSDKGYGPEVQSIDPEQPQSGRDEVPF